MNYKISNFLNDELIKRIINQVSIKEILHLFDLYSNNKKDYEEHTGILKEVFDETLN